MPARDPRLLHVGSTTATAHVLDKHCADLLCAELGMQSCFEVRTIGLTPRIKDVAI